MWYAVTQSLPAYVADPDNCAKYLACELDGNTWTTTNMDCPDCAFFDGDQHTCVSVDDSCQTTVSVSIDDGVTPHGAYSVTRHMMFQHAMRQLVRAA